MRTAFKRTKHSEPDTAYLNRFLVYLAASLLLTIAAFKFWPSNEIGAFPLAVVSTFEEPLMIAVDVPERTRQRAGVGAPSKPVIPLPVPTDRLVEDVIELPEFRLDLNLQPLTGLTTQGMPGEAGDGIVSNPARPASVLRIVEPIFPEEAQAAGLRAVIVVTFVVSSEGLVSDVSVKEIRLYSKDGNYSVTNKIGYGLVEATLRAALQWKFRPAQNEGKAVASYVRHEFSFGM